MGIDARIILRVPSKPSPDQLKTWSWMLGASVGADKLWFDKASGRPAITLSRDYNENEDEVYTGKVYHQDGDSLEAKDDWLLEVYVGTRFYGVGYERGDLLGLCAIAEWCEANIPDCEVWYGGDSSGVLVEPWPESKRRELRNHLYTAAGRAYFRHFDVPGSFPTPDTCSLCIGTQGFNRFGWGPKYSVVSCPGCGESFTSNDDGQTWTKREKDC